ncbi:cell death abnormality protein 1-like isoform X1 [Macrosteles quadrilineatus]|uniref:cell death abnormality protein 1-like isoform X1 n=1 Tax=Macrosteles quadrilineatus TaxID=74068 RepID=UPI0023E1A5FD|nr:cell death abnormality protein 1-like isoform X1 [Macrosteles quadrilineatus]
MNGLLIFWIWTLIYLSWGSSLVLSLEGLFGTEGVCKKDTKVTKSKPSKIYVTHTELKQVKCGFLGRHNCPEVVTSGKWLPQPDVTWEETITSEYCCDGYSEKEGRCEPECTSGCINGICRQPDHCICVGGFLKKEGTQECEPYCSTPCGQNQFCSRPNECSCNSGFEPDKDDPSKCDPSTALCSVPCNNGYCPEPTVCLCQEGYFFHSYEEQKQSRCDPICSKDCVNAECTAPGQCTCLKGYSRVDETVCAENVCEKPCVNGYCSDEKKCECKEGYKHGEKDPFMCEPICSKPCENGICINPEECTCLTNYAISEEDHYVCKPVCKNGCANGVCTLPDECTCNNGYKKDKENNCEPVCEEVCVNGFCSAPNTCSCLEGYEKDVSKPLSCRPICSKPCLNATCSAPETCTCYSGYEKVPNDDFRCLPICHEKCVNAECSDPEVCSCLVGFVKDIDQPNVCVPFCSKGCKNGHCAASETCLCNSGFKINEKDPSVCDPECSAECVNGFCSAPGVCTCNEGYQTNDNAKNKCQPVCKQECQHGTCSAPDKCSCNVGYKETNNPFVCSPHCTKACINGACTSPNLCECFPNYRKDKDEPHICQAVCEDECVNGYCKSKDVCECREGFVATDNPNFCEPMCSSCTNGVCESPENCKCKDGYENPPDRRDICVPVCEEKCDDGECVEPNVCGCSRGYEKKDGFCQPHCSGCEHGDCMAPGKCHCHPGYKGNKETGGCEAVCDIECVNGACSAPNECSCLWGFDLSDEDNKCDKSLDDDIYSCFFQGNFLSRKKSEICFTQELELKLTDLDECLFLTSIVLKYLQDSSNYEVTFNCILNYFSKDEKDRTLLLDCSTEKVVDVLDENDKSGNDLTGTKWIDDDGFDDEDDAVGKYFEDNSNHTENLNNESTERETAFKGDVKPVGKIAPKIYLPPLLPTFIIQPAKSAAESQKPQSAKEKEGRSIQDLLQTPSPIVEELDKIKPDVLQNTRLGIIPAIKTAIFEIKKDMKNLRKEIKEIEMREKEDKEADRIAKLKGKNKKEREEDESESESESGSDDSKKNLSAKLDDSEKEFTLHIHNVPRNTTQFPVVTKLSHLPFIMKQKITDAFFEDLTDAELLSEWCLCVKNDNSMCLDGKRFKMNLCPCKTKPTLPSVVGVAAMQLVYWTIAIVLAVLQIFIIVFLVRHCRKWSRRRKVAGIRDLQGKNMTTNSSTSSLQVRVSLDNENASNPTENVESSSKL